LHILNARGGWLYVATHANPGKPPSFALLKILILENVIQQNSMGPGTYFNPQAAPAERTMYSKYVG